MLNSEKLAQMSLPGGSAGPQKLAAPSGVPEAIRGGPDAGIIFFQTVVNNLIILGSFLALVMVIISGTQYIMSRGEPEKLASAKRRFLFAIVGLVVMLSAFFVVRVIVFITGGDFDQFMNPTSMLNEE